MSTVPKLTTIAACRVAGIDRDRFNEHVAAGRFNCAPSTVPGRARLFTPDAMLNLWLFRELMDDGFDATTAGRIACDVGDVARRNPDIPAISYLFDYVGGGSALDAAAVPPPSDWGSILIGGAEISKVLVFNIAVKRHLISVRTEEERSIIGPDD